MSLSLTQQDGGTHSVQDEWMVSTIQYSSSTVLSHTVSCNASSTVQYSEYCASTVSAVLQKAEEAATKDP